MKGKEIIEYYLRELEEEGVTYIPRWSPPVVSSTAMAIPVKAGPDCRDPTYTSEQVVGTPDGRSSKCRYSPDLFAYSTSESRGLYRDPDPFNPQIWIKSLKAQQYIAALLQVLWWIRGFPSP